VYILSKGSVHVGSEAGIVYSLLLVYNGWFSLTFRPFFIVSASLLVGLPLLLLWVANPH
jgi:Ni/Fe-hydrogenase subunit HybB-like protein